jgi:hypothetical protein
MKLYKIYIGANNETKKLEKRKIEDILNRDFEGYTLQEVTGYWQGTKEKTALVSLAVDNDTDITPTITRIKKELFQDAVMVEHLGVAFFL